jgi:hypothetical protein
MSTYWFRPKRYGYGATPVTWQGWALTFAGVLVIVAAAITFLGGHPPSRSALLAFFAVEAAVLAGLWVIVRRKTDGEWRWRWGDR